MTHKLKSILALTFISFLTACVSAPEPKDYTTFREVEPRSILIVPVMNHSPEAEAANFFLSTLAIPLAERGYYVFSTNMVKDLMQTEGMSDPYLVHSTATPQVAELFDADAVLYVEILDWRASYVVISSNITVHFLYTLKDGHTGELLWQDEEEYVHSKSSKSGYIFADLIVNAVQAAVDNVSADYTPVAVSANTRALLSTGRGLPSGPYAPNYGQDGAEFPSTGTGRLSNATEIATSLGRPADEITGATAETSSGEDQD